MKFSLINTELLYQLNTFTKRILAKVNTLIILIKFSILILINLENLKFAFYPAIILLSNAFRNY